MIRLRFARSLNCLLATPSLAGVKLDARRALREAARRRLLRAAPPLDAPPAENPTRYGDWECNGLCKDF